MKNGHTGKMDDLEWLQPEAQEQMRTGGQAEELGKLGEPGKSVGGHAQESERLTGGQMQGLEKPERPERLEKPEENRGNSLERGEKILSSREVDTVRTDMGTETGTETEVKTPGIGEYLPPQPGEKGYGEIIQPRVEQGEKSKRSQSAEVIEKSLNLNKIKITEKEGLNEVGKEAIRKVKEDLDRHQDPAKFNDDVRGVLMPSAVGQFANRGASFEEKMGLKKAV